MGHLDVVKSLLRSAAQSAAEPIHRSGLQTALRRRLAPFSFLNTEVTEQQLTRAVGRLPGVAAATVRIARGTIAVQLETNDSQSHAVMLVPERTSFAPRGAKEITFKAVPADMAASSKTADVCSAIASEVARALWHPLLRAQPNSPHLAFVHRNGALLTADLRTVPEVRALSHKPLAANIIDALALIGIEPQEGSLRLRLGVAGM